LIDQAFLESAGVDFIAENGGEEGVRFRKVRAPEAERPQ
jgi:hypothetical protein